MKIEFSFFARPQILYLYFETDFDRHTFIVANDKINKDKNKSFWAEPTSEQRLEKFLGPIIVYLCIINERGIKRYKGFLYYDGGNFFSIRLFVRRISSTIKTGKHEKIHSGNAAQHNYLCDAYCLHGFGPITHNIHYLRDGHTV